jgi:hypothetical protein
MEMAQRQINLFHRILPLLIRYAPASQQIDAIMESIQSLADAAAEYSVYQSTVLDGTSRGPTPFVEDEPPMGNDTIYHDVASRLQDDEAISEPTTGGATDDALNTSGVITGLISGDFNACDEEVVRVLEGLHHKDKHRSVLADETATELSLTWDGILGGDNASLVDHIHRQSLPDVGFLDDMTEASYFATHQRQLSVSSSSTASQKKQQMMLYSPSKSAHSGSNKSIPQWQVPKKAVNKHDRTPAAAAHKARGSVGVKSIDDNSSTASPKRPPSNNSSEQSGLGGQVRQPSVYSDDSLSLRDSLASSNPFQSGSLVGSPPPAKSKLEELLKKREKGPSASQARQIKVQSVQQPLFSNYGRGVTVLGGDGVHSGSSLTARERRMMDSQH